jgi:hypothetical protein
MYFLHNDPINVLIQKKIRTVDTKYKEYVVTYTAKDKAGISNIYVAELTSCEVIIFR